MCWFWDIVWMFLRIQIFKYPNIWYCMNILMIQIFKYPNIWYCMNIFKDTNLQISKYLNKAEQCFLTKLPVHFIRWPPMQLIQSLAWQKQNIKCKKIAQASQFTDFPLYASEALYFYQHCWYLGTHFRTTDSAATSYFFIS